MHPISKINASIRMLKWNSGLVLFISSFVYDLGKLSQVKFMVWCEYNKYNDLCASSEYYFTS